MTNVRPLSCVPPLVNHQARLHREPLITQSAPERLLLRVHNTEVRFQMRRLLETFPALFADVRFLSSVNVAVKLQSPGVLERFSALLAGQRSLASVQTQMDLPGDFGPKPKRAFGALKLFDVVFPFVTT